MKPCLKCVEENRRCEECRRKINLETNIWDDSNFGKPSKSAFSKEVNKDFGFEQVNDLVK